MWSHPLNPAFPMACSQGLVFAVASESGTIKLYDVRMYDKGPFDTFTVGAAPPADEQLVAHAPCHGAKA